MRKCEDKQNSPWRVHPLRDDFTIKVFQSVGDVERKKKKKMLDIIFCWRPPIMLIL